jgi:hypothetical protein
MECTRDLPGVVSSPVDNVCVVYLIDPARRLGTICSAFVFLTCVRKRYRYLRLSSL